MFLRRWEVRQVGKWNTEIEVSHTNYFFWKSNAKRRVKQNNEVAGKLDVTYKYVVVDKLTGEVLQ